MFLHKNVFMLKKGEKFMKQSASDIDIYLRCHANPTKGISLGRFTGCRYPYVVGCYVSGLRLSFHSNSLVLFPVPDSSLLFSKSQIRQSFLHFHGPRGVFQIYGKRILGCHRGFSKWIFMGKSWSCENRRKVKPRNRKKIIWKKVSKKSRKPASSQASSQVSKQ